MSCFVEGCECQTKAATLTAELEQLRTAHARQQMTICSYCGNEISRNDRSQEAFQDEIHIHVLTYEKRPERRLSLALYAILERHHPGRLDRRRAS